MNKSWFSTLWQVTLQNAHQNLERIGCAVSSWLAQENVCCPNFQNTSLAGTFSPQIWLPDGHFGQFRAIGPMELLRPGLISTELSMATHGLLSWWYHLGHWLFRKRLWYLKLHRILDKTKNCEMRSLVRIPSFSNSYCDCLASGLCKEIAKSSIPIPVTRLIILSWLRWLSLAMRIFLILPASIWKVREYLY